MYWNTANVSWNTTAEYIAIIIVAIICVHSGHTNILITNRIKLFRLSIITTFFTILSNLICIPMLVNPQDFPLGLTLFTTSINYILSPLPTLSLIFYAIEVLNEHGIKKLRRKYVIGLLMPAIIYTLLILINPFTEYMFSVNSDTYVRGPLTPVVYVLSYFYCLILILFAIFTKSHIPITERIVLLVFPASAIILIGIQQSFPHLVLAGLISAVAYLIIYLYLENKYIFIDYLTNLPHKQVLLKKLAFKIKRKSHEKFTIIVLSLRDFKHINNNYGQQYGNSCLQQVSIYLQKAVKPYFLFRFSGDEFAILIDKPFSLEIADFAISLKNHINSTWTVENNTIELSCVVSIAQYQEKLDTIEPIINGLEYSIKKAKQMPYEDYIYFSHEMLDELNRKNNIIEALKNNIKNNSFTLNFQPILDIKTSEFSFAESLLRLGTTEMGAISPNEFIPLAEETGLIIDITYQVIDKTCKFIKNLLDNGKNIIGISINLSALVFQEDNLKEKILKIISENSIPYNKVNFEITETVLIDKFDKVKDFILEMHEFGINFYLDDFGTGYSNMSSVFELPWNVIKLDKSLVWSSTKNPKAATVTRHLVKLFNELGVCVLAEGIETIEHSQFVKEIGCDMIQGFLYARPLSDKDASNILCTTYSKLMQKQ